MSVTTVGSAVIGTATNGGSVTLSFTNLSGLSEGDIVIVIGTTGVTSGATAGPSTAGYTAIYNTDAAAAPVIGAWYKVMGPTPDTQVVCNGSGSGVRGTIYGALAFRGIDTTTPIGAIVAAATPDSPQASVSRDGSFAIAASAVPSRILDVGTISGYSDQTSANVNETNKVTMAFARRPLTTETFEDPPAWTSLGVDGNSLTIIVNPVEIITVPVAAPDSLNISVTEASDLLTISNNIGTDTANISASETASIEVLNFTTETLYFTDPSNGTLSTVMPQSDVSYGVFGDDFTVEYVDLPAATTLRTWAWPWPPDFFWIYADANQAGKELKNSLSLTFNYTYSPLGGRERLAVLNYSVWVRDSSTGAIREVAPDAEVDIVLSATGYTDTVARTITIPTPITIGSQEQLAIAITIRETSADSFSGGNIIMHTGSGVTVDFYAASAATPIAGADAQALSVTESTSIIISDDVAVSDSSSVALTESVAVASDGASSDAAVLTISESSGLLIDASIVAADSAIVAISESQVISSDGLSSDAVVLSVSDSASILVLAEITAEETVTLAIAESVDGAVTATSADAIALATVETTGSFRTVATEDSASVTIAETGEVFSDRPGQDAAILSVTESTEITLTGTIDVNAADLTQLALADSTDTFIATSSTDIATIVITDTSLSEGINELAVTDVATVSISETSAVSSSDIKVAADGGQVSLSETTSVFKMIEASDTIVLVTTDEPALFITKVSDDSLAVTITENTSRHLELTANDSASVDISETTEFYLTKASDDALTLIVIEVVETYFTIEVAASDAASLGVAEVSATSAPGAVVRAYSNGAWHIGIVKVYVNGQWKVAQVKVYRPGGTWY